MPKVVTVGATAVFACILCATPLSLRLSPEGNVALSVDSASARIGRPLTATSVAGVNREYIGARIGVGTTVTMDTDTGHTSRRTDMGTRRPTAIAITSNPILGMALRIGNGGRCDRAISIIGEAPWAARS
jgi:hypothetical protein